MKVQVGKSDSSACILRCGPIARDDPDTEYRIAKKVGPGERDWKYIKRGYIEGEKRLVFELEEGEYHIGLFGDKTAGVATTAGHVVPYPWDVFLETPEDHSKDYRKVSIPTTRRGKPDSVKAAVSKALH